jgi:autotransporter-associated beta strand protein
MKIFTPFISNLNGKRLHKFITPFLMLLIGLGISQVSWGQTSFTSTSATGAWNSSRWNNTSDGPTYTAAFTTNNAVSFTSGSYSFAGMGAPTNVGNVTVASGVSVNFPSINSTFATNGAVRTFDIGSGAIFDFQSQSISTAAGTGFIKSGDGIFALGGNTYPGGFTLNAGTIVARGVNAMGQGGVLTINGGTIAANGNRDLTGKFSNIVVNSDFTLGSSTAPAVGTANLTFSNTMALGASTTRTITIGGTGTYTLGGVISGSSSNLTIASTAAGTIALTGANTYNGTTTVSGGTLQLNRTGGTTLPIGNNVVVNSGATLRISTAQQLNNVTVDAGGTLIVNATLTVSGTAAINGTLQIGQGGFANTTGGGVYNYGTNGTLAYNLTSGSYGPVDAGHTYWPATNGPINVTMTGTGTAAVNMGVARTVPGTFLLVSGANMVQGTALTLNGNVQINGGNFQTTPTYGSASTLIYNTNYGTSNEWTGGATPSVAAGSGIPANVQVLSGTVTLAGGRGVPGNVTVTAGGLVLNATAGDLYLGGNLTHDGTVWTNNSRAVVFVGTGTSVINTTANSGVQFFDYFLINKSAGSVQIGTTTNVTLNTTAGSVLQFLNAGTLDLNGRTLTMNNSGGNILVDGATGGTTKSIISSTGTGIIAITNNKTASANASGTLSTSAAVNWTLTGGMNFGGVTTINGILQLNGGGFVSTNAPVYGTGSTLVYNTNYGRNLEWSATSGQGYPFNVQIQNGALVDLSANGFANRAIAGNLNLGLDGSPSAGSLTMGATTNSLTVGGNVVIGGNTTGTSVLTLSSAIGGDIYLSGNWDTKTNGSYASNTRAVFFQGAGTSTVTTIGAATFDFLFINKTSGGTVSLANDMTVNNNLTLNAQLVTNAFKVIIPTGNNVTANVNGWVRGNLQKNIPTGTNSRTFEIGSSTDYTPVTTAYSGVTGAGNITVSTTNNDHPQIGSSTLVATKTVNRFYSIANSGVTGGSYDATFTFVAGDVDSGVSTSVLGIANYVNPTWTNLTIGARTSTTTQATGVTLYGDFQLGEGQTTWTAGASTTAWATSGNWSNGLPTLQSNVFIASASFYPVISSDVSVNSLTINSTTSVIVNSGFDLTVTNAIVNNGTLTLENNANLLQTTNDTNTGSGSTIVQRNSSLLKRLDYTLWSSPVTGQGLYAFSKFTLPNRFYVYDTATDLYNNSVGFNLTGLQYPSPLVSPNGVDGTDNANVQFTNGIGYLIRVPYNHPTSPTVYNGIFTGVANNGPISATVSTALNGFNAVGNPYPSRLNVHNFIDGNANITGPLYLWRKTNTTGVSNSYATLTKTAYVANGSAGGDTGAGFFPTGSGQEQNWVLNIGQGFIVKATSGSTVSFTNSMRRSSNANQFFRNSQTTTSINNGLYWLNLIDNTGVYSQMAVGYSSEGTIADDRGIDGENINKEFYLTSLIGAGEYSIQGRPEFESSDVVPLSYKALTSGNYSIAIDHADGLFTNTNQAIYLKDKLTATEHNLQTGAYNFTSVAGTFTNRFEIIYQSQLSIENPTFNASQVIVYKNELNDFVINSGTIIMASVKVFDIRGRLLLERNNINASQTNMTVGMANEVLLVQITSEDGVVVTKKVVR